MPRNTLVAIVLVAFGSLSTLSCTPLAEKYCSRPNAPASQGVSYNPVFGDYGSCCEEHGLWQDAIDYYESKLKSEYGGSNSSVSTSLNPNSSQSDNWKLHFFIARCYSQLAYESYLMSDKSAELEPDPYLKGALDYCSVGKQYADKIPAERYGDIVDGIIVSDVLGGLDFVCSVAERSEEKIMHGR